MMYRAAIIVLFLSLSSFAQQKSMLGLKSPKLSFQKILNYERSNANLSDFANKVVILDFWATWCGPCISSFPKLEALQSKFKGDLQVITITDDPVERIERFLNTKKLGLPVVIDEKRDFAKIFPHRTIPHTIVINKSGIVKAITEASAINEEVIQKVLSDHEIGIAEKKDVINFDPSLPLSGNNNFSYQVTIAPFKDGYPTFSNAGGNGIYKGRRILATNLSPQALFEIAYQFPALTRTVTKVSDPSKLEFNKHNAVCFELIVPEEMSSKRFEIMKEQLHLYFDYKSVIEEQIRPVKILRRIAGREVTLKESDSKAKSTASSGGKGLSMKNTSIQTVANFLESRLRQPVVDETDLKSTYDLELPWYNENPKQIYQELRKLGLELIDDQRKIKVLVIKDNNNL